MLKECAAFARPFKISYKIYFHFWFRCNPKTLILFKKFKHPFQFGKQSMFLSFTKNTNLASIGSNDNRTTNLPDSPKI